MSVCVGSAWKILPITARSTVPCGISPDVTSLDVIARSLWSSLDVTDSREKRNQGQSDFLRQKIW